MLIPGQIISIITFPGVIVHEAGHRFYCDRSGVKVLKVCYFRLGNPSGYVVHEEPGKFEQVFAICLGPFLTSSVLAVGSFLLAKSFLTDSVLRGFFTWLGMSIGMHSFPSSGDAKVLWRETNKFVRKNFLAILGYPFALIIWLANLAKFFWIDLLYAGLLYLLVF